MLPRGGNNMIAGSWFGPFGLEVMDYSKYPYSIFRFRWIMYTRDEKRYVTLFLR